MVANLFKLHSREWDTEKIESLFPSLVPKILSIKPSKQGAPDRRIWLKNTAGVYSTKTGYYSALEDRENQESILQQQQFNWIRDVWTLPTAEKIKVFIWKASLDALPVNANLANRQIILKPDCAICGESESILHLCFLYPFAQRVWDRVPFASSFRAAAHDSFGAGWRALQDNICLPPVGLGQRILAPWVIWNLWTARNYCIFQDIGFSEQETITKAIGDACEWVNAQSIIPPSHPRE
ncbi:unnamed protein product [Thlaspi arvense]|uniref:Reverse transcriptase zinc-binding domain-containing protein n=1 Tax=Thlaspi arvense TaxID=13288 RepID=A0AAU9S926_THLAR|nr:unnamed protein product [Thlaspi arvense]